MKKNVIFILLIFITIQGYSQNLNYGVRVGLNSSSLLFDNFPEHSNYKVGFQFNVMLKYNFNEKFGVGVEPGFANRGTVLRSQYYSDTKINLNYLVLPVVANYTLFDKFSICIGPECSYRISAKEKDDGKQYDVKAAYNSKIDFGVVAGFSYQIFDKFDIAIRYNRGFISTIKDIRLFDEHGIDKGKANVFNQGFTLSVSYMIN